MRDDRAIVSLGNMINKLGGACLCLGDDGGDVLELCFCWQKYSGRNNHTSIGDLGFNSDTKKPIKKKARKIIME